MLKIQSSIASQFLPELPSRSLERLQNEAQARKSRYRPSTTPSKPSPSLRSLFNNTPYHLYSIWLFSCADIKIVIIPKPLFGAATALAASVFAIPSSSIPSNYTLISRIPLAIAWCWINLLYFNIGNQRQPGAPEEDAANKPWRPIASKRMTVVQATRLLLVVLPAALLFSIYLRAGIMQCLGLMAMAYWYNDLNGSEGNVVRNFLNALGFVLHASGAMEVVLGGHVQYTPLLRSWFLIIGLIVSTTVHSQDMADQAGDKLRARRTIPLVIGDAWSRWSISIPMVFWAFFCPWYLSMRLVGYILPVVLGSLVAVRQVVKRNDADDKRTFLLWNVWMVMVYLLPLVKKISESL
ncbi:MAG: hypothetical protein MMC33_002100 [Icmadophila ericetorum]|nr:hypothetical protein [Icmadophila ericetorum]